MGVSDNILLGDGVFSVGGVDVALTRGGGQFVVKPEFKQIEADGDYGPVRGRQRKIRSIATLKISVLELLPANITKLYPGLNLNTSDASKTVLTAGKDIADTDYNTVTWTGKTKGGKPVIITLRNAINLEGIDWTLEDKEEVVPEVTYTAHYDENDRTTEPWDVQWFNTTNDAVAPRAVLSAPKAGASTQLVVCFNELLNSTTLAISDRFNLLQSITNDALGAATTVSIATAANSVTWLDANTASPKAIITITSTTFVAGQTVRLNFKANAVKDTATTPNVIPSATNVDAVVTT